MKQIRKKLKLIMYYTPSGYYDEKDSGYLFIKFNNKKRERRSNKRGNKTDLTLNELISELRGLFEGELENE